MLPRNRHPAQRTRRPPPQAEFPDEEVNNHVRSVRGQACGAAANAEAHTALHDVAPAQALASVLNDATLYSDEKVEDWTHQIIEGTLKGLREINRPFKYIGAAPASLRRVKRHNGTPLHAPCPSQ